LKLLSEPKIFAAWLRPLERSELTRGNITVTLSLREGEEMDSFSVKGLIPVSKENVAFLLDISEPFRA
jgi:hypothetical protein